MGIFNMRQGRAVIMVVAGIVSRIAPSPVLTLTGIET